MRALLLCLPLALAACADLPDVETTISPASQAADFPDLVPLGPLLATLPPAGERPGETAENPSQSIPSAEMDARTRRLQARAQALRDASL